MIIEISAFDTLFFRNGKPFNAGDESWAEGIFPPSPSVLYGALRTCFFASNMKYFKIANTDQDPTRNFEITDIFYKINNTTYYTSPLDLVCLKNKTATEKNKEKHLYEYKLVPLVLKNNDGECFYNSLSNKLTFLGYDEEVENLSGGVLPISALYSYLNGDKSPKKAKSLNDYIIKETKTSIKLNAATGTTEDNFLFTVDMCRPNNLSICVNFKNLVIPKEGYMKLGGENKAVYYRELKEDYNESLNLEGTSFKLYLSTAAILEQGWLPSWIDAETMIGEINGMKLKLITAAIGKYKNIGGFDLKLRKPKPMRRAVPEGSVYFFDILSGDIDMAYKTFNNKSISEFNTSNQGFGICRVGRS